jgi:hypothetical protein
MNRLTWACKAMLVGGPQRDRLYDGSGRTSRGRGAAGRLRLAIINMFSRRDRERQDEKPAWRARRVRTTIDCRQSEIEASLPHEQSHPSEWPRPQAPVPASRAKTGLKKKLPRKIPRKPLISLDSDERIQGNPRNSNLHKQGFSRRNGEAPRKPKLIDAFRQRLLRPVRQSRYRLLD